MHKLLKLCLNPNGPVSNAGSAKLDGVDDQTIISCLILLLGLVTRKTKQKHCSEDDVSSSLLKSGEVNTAWTASPSVLPLNKVYGP